MLENKKENNTYTASEMKKIVQTAEMALWLDGYDDIFSDFDPRPYSERSLSDDFLVEMKKASRGRGRNGHELKFLLNPKNRDEKTETIITARLEHFFNHCYKQAMADRRKILVRGLIFVCWGTLLMLAASFLVTYWGKNGFVFNFLITIAEPAGWFLFWEGLARAMYKAEELNPEIEFYEKMGKSRITFLSF